MRLKLLAPVLAIALVACQAPAQVPASDAGQVEGHHGTLSEAQMATRPLRPGQIGLVRLEPADQAPLAGDTGTAGIDILPLAIEDRGNVDFTFDAHGAEHTADFKTPEGKTVAHLLGGQSWRGEIEAGTYTIVLTHHGSGGTSAEAPVFVQYENREVAPSFFRILGVTNSSPSPLAQAVQIGLSVLKCPNCDFQRSDLSGMDLTGGDFSGADFQGANVRGTKFDRADLSGAKFSSRIMGAVDAVAVNPSSMQQSIDIRNGYPNEFPAGFGLQIPGGPVPWTQLDGSSFKGAVLKGATFRGSALTNVGFSGADATAADFSYSQIVSGNFKFADAPGANFDYSYIASTDMSDCVLSDATLRHAGLSKSHFDRSSLDRVSAPFLRTEQCTFDAASFKGADFKSAYFGAGTVTGVDFSNASFMTADLTFVTFHHCVLRAANFAGAKMSMFPGAFTEDDEATNDWTDVVMCGALNTEFGQQSSPLPASCSTQ